MVLILALVTGMRRGELLGLKWEDIDFLQGTLLVKRSLAYISSNETTETAPKTERDQRQIALPAFVFEALRNYQEAQQVQRLRAGTSWQERGFVFTNQEGGPLAFLPLLKQFAEVLEEAGLPVMHFHDLRNSARFLTF